LVEKLVELGVTRLVPLVTLRAGEQTLASGERLRRAVIEASKQCGRNRLMQIDNPQALGEFLASADDAALRWIAEPGQRNGRNELDRLCEGRRPAELVLAIGPEGGFTAAEIEVAAARGWQPIGLGPRVLRIETAALALVAAIAIRLEGTDEGTSVIARHPAKRPPGKAGG
jgi:16S rRNA (uracil1498-N3)-methyltransferase